MPRLGSLCRKRRGRQKGIGESNQTVTKRRLRSPKSDPYFPVGQKRLVPRGFSLRGFWDVREKGLETPSRGGEGLRLPRSLGRSMTNGGVSDPFPHRKRESQTLFPTAKGKTESQIVSRQWGGNFCRGTSRCLAGPSGFERKPSGVVL